MSFIHATQMIIIINPFINSNITANHEQVEELSANSEVLKKEDCFSIVKSLLDKSR